jgi:hypothetical protein
MAQPVAWHDLLGLICTDLLADSPFAVEAEKDLSLRKQLLDLVIVRRSDAPFAGRLPDGLDDLVRHNLLTFKSFQETLDAWAMKELLAHYVNYRKQVSPSTTDLLPLVGLPAVRPQRALPARSGRCGAAGAGAAGGVRLPVGGGRGARAGVAPTAAGGA